MIIKDFTPTTKEDRLLMHNVEITLNIITSLPKELNIPEPSLSIDSSGQLVTITVCMGGVLIAYEVTKDNMEWHRI